MKKIYSALLLAIISFTTQAQSVDIWIRAFIPNVQNAGGGGGYIYNVPNGSAVKIRSESTGYGNECFLTDNRGFSTNSVNTSRSETKFKITYNNGTGSVTPASKPTTAAITTKIDCSSAAVLASGPGKINLDAMGHPATASGTVQVIGQVSVKNVLTRLGNAGPAIDYSYDIQWTAATSTLKVTATVGSFPAFEMYARINGGNWVPVIQELPIGTPWSLGADGFGINSRNITKTKVIN